MGLGVQLVEAYAAAGVSGRQAHLTAPGVLFQPTTAPLQRFESIMVMVAGVEHHSAMQVG